MESFYQQRFLSFLFLTHDLLRILESHETPVVAVYRVVVSEGQWEKRISHVTLDQKGDQRCESPKAIRPTVGLCYDRTHFRTAGSRCVPCRWTASAREGWQKRLGVLWQTGKILGAAACDFSNVKTAVWPTDISGFHTVRDIYKLFFQGSFSVSEGSQVVALPKGSCFEIEAVAVRGPLVTWCPRASRDVTPSDGPSVI